MSLHNFCTCQMGPARILWSWEPWGGVVKLSLLLDYLSTVYFVYVASEDLAQSNCTDIHDMMICLLLNLVQ